MNADLIGLSGLISRRWTRWLTWRKRWSARASPSAIDWRRDHLKSAHGGENRANYSGPTVYVQNASRTVGVVGRCFPTLSAMISLLVPARSTNRAYSARTKETTHTTGHAGRARDNDFAFDWQAYTPPVAHLSVCRKSKPASKRCVITSTGAVLYDLVAGREVSAHSGR